jgi:hypothetical protein
MRYDPNAGYYTSTSVITKAIGGRRGFDFPAARTDDLRLEAAEDRLARIVAGLRLLHVEDRVAVIQHRLAGL